jgi:ankyrin repeat protein
VSLWSSQDTTLTETRRHVFSDLRPYACTFDDCNVEDFESRREWFEHELRVHRREWYCLKCSDTTFHTKAQLADHFKAAHQDITDRQVSIILEASSKPRRYFDESSCPFHESWQPAPNIHLTLDPNDNRKDFARHLAHDLRQLALSAIQLSWVKGLELREDAEAPEGSADEELDENLEAVDNGEDFGDKLVSAILARDENVVKELILMPGTDVNQKNRSGWTALSSAARRGDEAVVKLLLETGKVEVDLEDTGGRTPLSWAAENGHEAVVKLLLETGKAEVDLKDISGQTPLSRAAQNGHEAVVELLLETGKVEVDSKNIHNQTPLSWAAENGHEAVVKLLLETGKVEVDSKKISGLTPLSLAVVNGHEAVAKLLRKHIN